jgi:Core-2/I-Branching enzyme
MVRHPEPFDDQDPKCGIQENKMFKDISSLREKESLARIAYLITVHNYRTLEDATPLFQRIRSPLNLIFIHVDTKLDPDVFYNSSLYDEILCCPCGSYVLASSVYSAKWSAWSMNDPTFWGMKQALLHEGKWDIFVNLSGDSMPVYRTDVIARLFAKELKGMNFVTSSSCETGLIPTNVYYFPKWWHKRKHYTTHPDGDVEIEYISDDGEEEKITLQIYFGSQWVALLPEFCSYIMKSLSRKDSLPSRFRDYLLATERLMTDETFLPTLLMHVMPFNETTVPRVLGNGSLASHPLMTALRFERMDEHGPTAFFRLPRFQRYDVPDSSIADVPKPWGPYFLGAYDLRSIRETGALYIRKVSKYVEPNLYNIFPVSRTDDIPDIFWPKEVKISEKIDWEKRIKELDESVLLGNDDGKENTHSEPDPSEL